VYNIKPLSLDCASLSAGSLLTIFWAMCLVTSPTQYEVLPRKKLFLPCLNSETSETFKPLSTFTSQISENQSSRLASNNQVFILGNSVFAYSLLT
jgi:hypothetical protein